MNDCTSDSCSRRVHHLSWTRSHLETSNMFLSRSLFQWRENNANAPASRKLANWTYLNTRVEARAHVSAIHPDDKLSMIVKAWNWSLCGVQREEVLLEIEWKGERGIPVNPWVLGERDVDALELQYFARDRFGRTSTSTMSAVSWETRVCRSV